MCTSATPSCGSPNSRRELRTDDDFGCHTSVRRAPAYLQTPRGDTNAVRNKGENMRLSPVHRVSGALLVLALLAFVPPAHASSHREALAILNEPCADNTDTFAWVSNGAHDKLYLIMDYNPLHEPGQGNQGFRACNGYRYEFHIGKGASLADQAVYRVEFKNTLNPAPAPSPTDGVGGGNELLWQLTGGTATSTV